MDHPAAIPHQLYDRARHDNPTAMLAYADEDAWARAEGHGSPIEAEALRRTDAEAWIPGLPARRTVMTMGWIIFFAVMAGWALTWVPDEPWVEPVATSLKGVAGLAVAAAAWSILSEMRGWEGSDASRWLLKRRAKAFRKRLEARQHELRDTLVAIAGDGIAIYRIEGGDVSTFTYHPADIETVSVAPAGRHMSLCLITRTRSWTLDWLPCDPAIIAAVERLSTAATESATTPLTQGS